jgi:beta-mannosidase
VVHLPLGLARPVEADVGLTATARVSRPHWALVVRARRFAQSVVVDVPGFQPEDSWFHLAPGTQRVLTLEPLADAPDSPAGQVRALNSIAGARVKVEP